MQVLLLSPYSDEELEPVLSAFDKEGDHELIDDHDIDTADIVVCYGYRKIIPDSFLAKHRCINIHISYIPFNRGASPNLWSWYDDTPKGVSILQVDKSIDGGPILARRLVNMTSRETMESSYLKLRKAAGDFFYDLWPAIRAKNLPLALQMPNTGSYHTQKASNALLERFPDGYQTKCSVVEQTGRQDRFAANKLAQMKEK